MSLVSSLLHQSIDIYSVTLDKFADVTRTLVYKNVKCRWQEVVNKVLTSSGEEKISNIDVWILPDYTVDESYEVKSGSKYYKILSVSTRYDLGGNVDHIRLYLE